MSVYLTEEGEKAFAEGAFTEATLSELLLQHAQWVSSWKPKGKLMMQIQTGNPDIWEILLEEEKKNLAAIDLVRSLLKK